MEGPTSPNDPQIEETSITRQDEDNHQALSARSTEVQEIIGRPAHWLVRRGIAGLFGIVILILLAAWVIKYPDAIKAPLQLTAINAPKMLKSNVNGKLVKLLVKNNTHVKRGQILAWLESTASHRQVLALSRKVDNMRQWIKIISSRSLKRLICPVFRFGWAPNEFPGIRTSLLAIRFLLARYIL